MNKFKKNVAWLVKIMTNGASRLLLFTCATGLLLACEEEDNACETQININGKKSYFCINTISESGCATSSSSTTQVLHEGKSCQDIGYMYESSSGGFYSEPNDNSQPGDGGSFSGSSGSAGAGCDGYDGPTFDIQIDSQCQTAYAYSCSGVQQGVDAACAIYKTYQRNDPSIPDCPYCN